MTADDAAAAFIAGRIPAAVTWEPHLTLVKTKKSGKVLIDSIGDAGRDRRRRLALLQHYQGEAERCEAFVKALYRGRRLHEDQSGEGHAIMAKGVGGYLEKPEGFRRRRERRELLRPGDDQRILGTAEKPGPIADVIKLGDEIWSDLGKMSGGKIDYPMIVDNSAL